MVQTDIPAVNDRFVLPSSISEGGRNNTLYKYACSLWAKDFNESALEDELLSANATVCTPPLPEAEVRDIVKHVVQDLPRGLSPEYASKRVERIAEAILSDSKTALFAGVGINDRELSKVFADLYRDRLRYVNEANGWYAYNGKYWLTNKQGGDGIASMLIKDFVAQLQAYTATISEDEVRTAAQKEARKYNDHRKRVGLLEDCKGELSETITAFDTNTNLFNVKNGTIELRPFKFREHRAEDLITKVAGCAYMADANTADWEGLLSRTFEGHEELRRFLQVRLAMALAGDTGLECFYILYGEPRTGKSTFTETIKSTLGDYATTAQPSTFAKSTRNSQQASPDYAALFGTRFVVCPEPNEDMVLSADFLKQVTGNDTITARHLHGEFFNFRPCFILVFNTNYLPQTTDRTLFTSGRVNVVPFLNVVPEGERDSKLKKRLECEETKSAVLNWLLQGLQVQDAFNPPIPKRVLHEVARYKEDSDRLGMFVDELCEEGAEGYLQDAKSLYEAYTGWCTEVGIYPVARSKFINQMQRRGYHLTKRTTFNGVQVRNVFSGIRLVTRQA